MLHVHKQPRLKTTHTYVSYESCVYSWNRASKSGTVLRNRIFENSWWILEHSSNYEGAHFYWQNKTQFEILLGLRSIEIYNIFSFSFRNMRISTMRQWLIILLFLFLDIFICNCKMTLSTFVLLTILILGCVATAQGQGK